MFVTALLSSGAELLRRTFSSDRNTTMRLHRSQSRRHKKGLSRSDRKASISRMHSVQFLHLFSYFYLTECFIFSQALSSIRLVEKLERIGLESLVTPSANAPDGRSLYFNPAQRSTMGQLTGVRSPVNGRQPKPSFVLGGDDDSDIPILGMPAKPGSGQLDSRLNRLQQMNHRPVRTDLGSVPGTSSSSPVSRGARARPDLGSVPSDLGVDSHSSSTLGTLSSLWFGRKGGLL